MQEQPVATAIGGKLGSSMRSALLAACLILPAALAHATPPEPVPALPRYEDFPAGPAYAGRNRLVLKGRRRALAHPAAPSLGAEA